MCIPKIGRLEKIENATGKWDLLQANSHMYKIAMTREFLADNLDSLIC